MTSRFIGFFDERRAGNKPLVLVTVVDTGGSSYSKAGHLVLIGDDSDAAGIVSGGCLEGDLADRATRVLAEGVAAFVDYDLRDDDEVFGLGVGCDGTMRLLLQPLTAANHYEPLASIVAALQDGARIDAPFATGNGQETIDIRIHRPPNLLILGAGPDISPLLGMVEALGWSASVSDHRQHYVDRLGPGVAECRPAAAVASQIDLGRFDAAIVMSHHLASDRSYLGALAETDIPFVGLLGPPRRRERLLDELGDAAKGLGDRLRSPVGKKIGGRGPAAIALEIVAELQAFFSARD
ncbi:MAG: XdhC family protein [Gammaproteobacteria bacterium]|nr:XdhC family protein [Gammaproteobacteria bacterium]